MMTTNKTALLDIKLNWKCSTLLGVIALAIAIAASYVDDERLFIALVALSIVLILILCDLMLRKLNNRAVKAVDYGVVLLIIMALYSSYKIIYILGKNSDLRHVTTIIADCDKIKTNFLLLGKEKPPFNRVNNMCYFRGTAYLNDTRQVNIQLEAYQDKTKLGFNYMNSNVIKIYNTMIVNESQLVIFFK